MPRGHPPGRGFQPVQPEVGARWRHQRGRHRVQALKPYNYSQEQLYLRYVLTIIFKK